MAEDKLTIWQERLAQSDKGYDSQRSLMDERESLYKGTGGFTAMTTRDKDGTATHIRNIIFENIESMVSSSIPHPKVTPRNEGDEKLADVIEHFLRNELDRLPFEQLNDMAERTVPIQGGVGFLIDWNNDVRTHDTIGAVEVTELHPKQFGPQPKVYTSVDDMDWFIVKLPTTKGAIERKYGVTLEDEGESEPELRSAEGEGENEDAITQYIGYERGENGINKYSWVNDTEIENIEDYQARRIPVCAHCGRVKPLKGQILSNISAGNPSTASGPPPLGRGGNAADEEAGVMLGQQLAGTAMGGDPSTAALSVASDSSPSGGASGGALESIDVVPSEEPERYDGGACPWCGSNEWTDEVQEYEQVMLPIRNQSGLEVPGMTPGIDESGSAVMQPTLIPFYKPDVYPIVLQKSVSVYGQLLGSSDVDMIKTQQSTTNRLNQKIITRLIDAGSVITLPDDATKFRIDSDDNKKYYIKDPASKSLIDMYTFEGNLQYELAYLSQVYEEARQILGITDSFQGRTDATATSAVAKQFSAAQAAGRLESKRTMKDAAYARIFELMFKFWLAYSDEPRPITYRDSEGKTRFEEFNRYDFLKQDADGQYYWNDQFLFSCDTSAPLASNREAMWQETRLNLQTGAFGDPTKTETLILFWAKMEMLHYPGASDTKKALEEQAQREQEAMMQQAGMMGAAGGASPTGGANISPMEASQGGGKPFMGSRSALGIDQRMLDAVDRQAEKDAAASASGNDLRAERAGIRERGLY